MKRVFAWLALACAMFASPASAQKLAPAELLSRAHSPVLGPANAKVTIVEVLDPLCEACRAFHPHVKQVLARYPGQVRLVMRYAAFHRGSDVVIGMLEMARIQGVHTPVLEALFARQPEWAKHGAPDIALAWRIVRGAGLDASDARQREALPGVAQVLRQDAADVDALLVDRTPTFFVNGRMLEDLSAKGLADLVASELAKVRR